MLLDPHPVHGDPTPSVSTTLDPPDIPLDPPPCLSGPLSDGRDLISACGITWDHHDIARFLSRCTLDPSTGCLVWAGAKSRGRGKTIWYGSFHVSAKPGIPGKTVRAHKFYSVAVLGHRPKTGIHQLDHVCVNSLCVRHIACVPAYINRALQWIRVQVGLDSPPDYYAAVITRLSLWVSENPRPDQPEWQFDPDPFDPRFWVNNQNSEDILTHTGACG